MEKEFDLLEEAKKSYITKEELIKMIENINFTHVEEFELKVITGFIQKFNAEDKPYIQTLGSKISLY